MPEKPIPVTAGSKAWAWGCLLAETAGSNSARGTDVCLLWTLCVVRQRYVSVMGWSLVQRSSIECVVSKAGITQGYFTHYSVVSSTASLW